MSMFLALVRSLVKLAGLFVVVAEEFAQYLWK